MSDIDWGVQGLGCMGMSEFYGDTDPAEARATLALALDCGVRMFDTADMYGLGANEEFLAPFVRAHRQRVLIATKFGYTRTAANPDDWGLDNRPAYIRGAVERSLKRLGVDTIDLYYMHRRQADVPIEDSVGAMADLVAAGKVRWLGLCEVSADELRAAHAVHPISALQSEWSVFSRGLEGAVLDVARGQGTAVVPFAPLGRGLLTGAALALDAGDARRHFPRFQDGNRDANQALAAQVATLAAGRGISAAQMALAWLYTRAEALNVKVVPIPGTRRRSRLSENLQAAAIRLNDAEMAALNQLAASVRGVGV
ncbi:aldo/keto reductase [Duganella sp. P38]|jgi:aryl-alcohol dehydrogenase-like predicted oxidoreductase|uniref:aldo/keto reductase n=1 Tax=Duganella sp. P38 TaxID=3423949 RepID=UPI003D7918E4